MKNIFISLPSLNSKKHLEVSQRISAIISTKFEISETHNFSPMNVDFKIILFPEFKDELDRNVSILKSILELNQEKRIFILATSIGTLIILNYLKENKNIETTNLFLIFIKPNVNLKKSVDYYKNRKLLSNFEVEKGFGENFDLENIKTFIFCGEDDEVTGNKSFLQENLKGSEICIVERENTHHSEKLDEIPFFQSELTQFLDLLN